MSASGSSRNKFAPGSWVGAHTALVTPFLDGKVCWEDLRRLVDLQIEAGIDGLVSVGTTGESPTLDYDEHVEVIARTVEYAAGRVPVMAGTGSNATTEALDLTRRAEEAGADAFLLVAPYYNKPSQEGLFRHFAAIAEATAKPIMLYSIPGRCGVEITVETVLRLRARFPHVVGIKEAGGQVEKAARLVRESDADFIVLSGDDSLTLPFAEVGARGVVSVASNLIPGPVARLAQLARTKQFAEAKVLHDRLAELFRTLFVEPNPVPVKHCMMRAGIIRSAEVRLPLCEMSEANRRLVEKVADAALSVPR
ncbi:MAG: 4-hydroxy-tetrahydrodipicolinate synthase [Opitutia bacterium]